MTQAFPFLLLPHVWSSRNRARRRQKGDVLRASIFGSVGVAVCGALFAGAYWLTTKLAGYEEFGDYLLRLGLSWLFLTFLAFLAFSGVVTALSTFFLSDDLRLLMGAPVSAGRLFMARFTRTVGQASWMVIFFMAPILLAVGVASCAPPGFYLTAALAVVPFVVIPVAIGAGITLLLVNVLPARRARDLLMLTSLLFAAAIVLTLRFIQPERLMRVENLPDVTDFFATLQSPITPLLPSFWAGEVLFAGLQGGSDLLHGAALWTTALAFTVVLARGGSPLAFRRLQPIAGVAEGARDVAPHRRCGGARAAALDGAPAAARQGCEGVPPRRQPVAAAAAAVRPGAALSV